MVVSTDTSVWMTSMAIAQAGRSGPRRTDSPVWYALGAHAALFILGTVALGATAPFLPTALMLYIAFLLAGVVAWSGLLCVGLGAWLAQGIRKIARRVSQPKAERPATGRLATA